ncbi:G-type lectin S-receptor-like serine/threonine-protein kinase LECRK3 [Prunus yedoensis var. nudiflora]|uniref:G-type lectin S-receptor-like serine/threonine-protein kinase LECRK3 n=1 Tax=Prunus yedoensis var. nudiflora TaxID=2094558 RepID=A0A314Y742_PRUYE|nr:G-type lectin S-receptor-like serine/threonine-protein kinase LECRK3 [Prunus yedoensis var. nudiflora]
MQERMIIQLSSPLNRKAEVSLLYPIIQGINLKCFTYMEIKVATNGFMEELGRGTFATVFKGILASDDGKCVAVKRLDTMNKSQKFSPTIGFCNEVQHRILVYEFMSNGFLASLLFGDSRPSWYRRRDIALGTARGLFYLHEQCSSQIIHCDIKPQNILLDDSFTARIADFSVAKLLKIDQT